MSKIGFLLTLLVTVLVCLLPAVPAQAQSNRTFVSAAGNDSNNCATVSTPCRHLANAYAATAANGEIDVLDPANYGALTITGPVSIEGHGWASIAAVSGSAAITINANTGDKINIIGVVLDGIAIANTTGISFNSGGSLTVRDSVVRNFGYDGIDFYPTASGTFFISNTLLSDNGGTGIAVTSTGSGTTNGVLNHVDMVNNEDGIIVQSTNQTVNVTISDSVSANNTAAGIGAESDSGMMVSVMVRNSTSANNGTDGLYASGTGATLLVTRSTITGNITGWSAPTGIVSSYGDNNIDGNGGANTEPPNPLPYK
jgi:Right handed beta helix region